MLYAWLETGDIVCPPVFYHQQIVRCYCLDNIMFTSVGLKTKGVKHQEQQFKTSEHVDE